MCFQLVDMNFKKWKQSFAGSTANRPGASYNQGQLAESNSMCLWIHLWIGVVFSHFKWQYVDVVCATFYLLPTSD